MNKITSTNRVGAEERLKMFDDATKRQSDRQLNERRGPSATRGWTRDELYDRGRSR